VLVLVSLDPRVGDFWKDTKENLHDTNAMEPSASLKTVRVAVIDTGFFAYSDVQAALGRTEGLCALVRFY
jgi:hypothetical protein